MEHKIATHFTKAIADDGTVTGVFAVHGNVDEGMDRSHPGAFADVKINGRDRVRFLWQHDSMCPPVAVIKSIKEVSRDQLPGEVLSYAPDATGGCEVMRQYLPTPRGQEILECLKSGVIQEMSYAYDVKEWSFTADEENDRTIRELIKLALYDISDVNWGMNPATVASKNSLWLSMPVKDHSNAIIQVMNDYIERLKQLSERRSKEGRVLSDSNRNLIGNVADQIESTRGSLAEVRKALQELLTATEPKTTDLDVHRLWIQYQATLAQLNGVNLS